MTQWLEGRKTLLVLDDVWHGDVQGLAPGPPVSVLYTSRRRDVVGLAPRQRIPVSGFSGEEQAAFLNAQEVEPE